MLKNQPKTKQQPEAEFWLFENNSPSSSTLSFKNDRRFSKNVQENKYICLDEVIMINDYENETESEKQNTQIRHK